MLKLDIQRFGGRGASSSASGGAGGSSGTKITFNNVQKGDTFELESQYGGTYSLKVGNKMPDGGFYVEGRLQGESGTYIGSLVSDTDFKNASAISKQFMIPMSRTKNWKRK